MAPSFRPYNSVGKPFSKATFEYEVTEDKIVIIIDHDNGPSVTNDAANVLKDIAQAECLPSLLGHQVIYQDTTKRWDGIRLDERGQFEDFYAIGAANEAAAVAWVRAKVLSTH